MLPSLQVLFRRGPARGRGRGPARGRAVDAVGVCVRAPRRGAIVTRGHRDALILAQWWHRDYLIRHRVVGARGGLGPPRGGPLTAAGSRNGIEGGTATATATVTMTATMGETEIGNRSADEAARARTMTNVTVAGKGSGQVAGGTAGSAAVLPISYRRVVDQGRTLAVGTVAGVWAVVPRGWPAGSTAAVAVPWSVAVVP